MGDHLRAGPRPGSSPRPLGRRLTAVGLAVGLGLALAVVGSAPAGAATTTEVTARVSVTSTGTEVKTETEWIPLAVDTTGRLVAFSGSGAYDPADTNGQGDVYVRDRLAGTTTRVSLTDAEAQITGSSTLCGASGDLRYVGFWSNGTNVPSTVVGQIYVRDRLAGNWTQQLDSGATTRGSVMVGFSESAEGRAFLAPQVDVVLVTLGMLHDIGKTSELASLYNLIIEGVPLEEVIASLRTSPVYAATLGS